MSHGQEGMHFDAHYPRVDNRAKVWGLVNDSGDDVVVGERRDGRWGMPMLLPDDVKNGFLDVKEHVLQTSEIAG